VFGEFYLRQKKLSESAASYAFIQENYPDASISDVAILREALVRLKLNQLPETEILAEQLTKTKLADKGWVLLGEIQEKIKGNPEEALNFYYKFLDECPESYLTEPVRLHIRKLKDHLKS
jgi:hypothetical protein